MRRVFLCLIASLSAALFLGGCGGNGGTGSAGDEPLPEAEWTIMVYMAGDSDISQAALYNINDMERIGSTDQVNIVVQVEFSTEFSPSLPGNTLRGRISKDDDEKTIGSTFYDIGNLDMTDPDMLTDFITFSALKYPARHYAIILWSHGLGWKYASKGIIKDVTSAGEYSIMSIPEIANALKASGLKFDLIDFDACLMGMYEVAYELRGLSEFISFSEALFPVYGNPYDIILNELTTYPDIAGQDLAHIITSSCAGYYKSLGWSFTKSTIRATEIEKVYAGVNDLANVLYNNMDTEGIHIRTAVGNTIEYYSYIYRDLGDFIDQLRTQTQNQDLLNSAISLDAVLKDLVVESFSYSPEANDPITRSHGLSIYLPSPGLNISRDIQRYSALSCNQGDQIEWVDFITRMDAEY